MTDDFDREKLLESLSAELGGASRHSLEENIRKGIEIKSLMKELKENEAFRLYCDLLKRQCDFRTDELCKTRPGLDGAIENTHTIGEIAGIRIALNFVEAVVEEASDAIQMNQHVLNSLPAEEEEPEDGR